MRLFRRIAAYALLIAIIVGSGLLLWQRQAFGDWLVLRNYQASPAIAQLASDATMTNLAKHLFYINKPQLEARPAFNQHCTNKTEQTVVLGCYTGDRQGIYLYSVTDSRLHGVEQVTAAHEMLHQAYDRLSSAERQHINTLVENYYNHGLTDQTVKAQIAAYRQSEPHDVDNEMHSLFGTEVSSLPPQLEQYYARYFRDRAKVVAYNTAYQTEFTKRKQQVASYDQQLASMKTQLTAKEQDLMIRQTNVRQKKQQLDNENTPDQVDTYNADITAYNAMVQTYNDELTATKALISQYNQLVQQRNSIAMQEQQLQQALDSQLTPVGGQ